MKERESRSSGDIRLGCVSCDRDDFDGVTALPTDWANVQEVQSAEEALRETLPLAWETHLGICPNCQSEGL